MAFAPQISQNHGLQLFCPTSFTQPYPSAKTCYAPATAQPIIVLPAFARSLSADREKNENFVINDIFSPSFRRSRREGRPAKRRRGESICDVPARRAELVSASHMHSCTWQWLTVLRDPETSSG